MGLYQLGERTINPHKIVEDVLLSKTQIMLFLAL
jgi:hypothetical protein